VALVEERVAAAGVVDHPAGGGDVPLLHGEHHVVLERLRAPLDEQVVGR